MTLYELYEEFSVWPYGQKRIKLFTVKKNALEFKKEWEKRWQYNNKNCISKDPDPWITKSELILKTVETDD